MEMTGSAMRAASGAKWLDQNSSPQWHWHVDLEALNLTSPDKCILGQLFEGKNPDYFGYSWVMATLISSSQTSRALGFNGTEDDYHEDIAWLENAWRDLILERRGQEIAELQAAPA